MVDVILANPTFRHSVLDDHMHLLAVLVRLEGGSSSELHELAYIIWWWVFCVDGWIIGLSLDDASVLPSYALVFLDLFLFAPHVFPCNL
jgi:hypothetical protein